MLSDGSGITLIEAQYSDAEQLNNWWNDGAVMAHAGYPNGIGQSLENTRQTIHRSQQKNTECLWIIRYDDVPIGECNYRLLQSNLAECGWKICEEDYQNQGLGTRIIRMVLHYLFFDPSMQAQFPIEKVVWDTNLTNLRAQYVYEHKIGAQRTGVRKNCWQDQLGNWQSAVDYCMTKDAFKSIQETMLTN